MDAKGAERATTTSRRVFNRVCDASSVIATGHRPRPAVYLRWVIVLVLLAATGCVRFTEPKLQSLIEEVPARVEIPPMTGKSGKVDVVVEDQANHLLYMADTSQPGIDVFDVTTFPGSFVKTIHTVAVPSGLAFVPGLQRLYAGMDDSTLAVFNANPSSAKPFTLLKAVDTKGAGAADLVDYDPKQRKIYVTNPDDGFLSSISVDTDKVAKINGLGLLGQPKYDAYDGMVYVLSVDRNSIFKIDPSTDKAVQEYPIGVICEPHGLDINPATNKGLIGCGDRDTETALSWDFTAGRLVKVFDQAGAGDIVIFDQKAQHFYFAASNYQPAEIAIFNADPVDFMTAVPTSHGSHNVVYDETHQTIYTFDARHLESGLWAFHDPVAGCFGPQAQSALFASSGGKVPGCHVFTPTTSTTSTTVAK